MSDEILSDATDYVDFECTLTNLGSMHGDEVVQVFHRFAGAMDGDMSELPHYIPYKSLVDFQRVHVQAASQSTVKFTLNISQALSLTLNDGSKVCS